MKDGEDEVTLVAAGVVTVTLAGGSEKTVKANEEITVRADGTAVVKALDAARWEAALRLLRAGR